MNCDKIEASNNILYIENESFSNDTQMAAEIRSDKEMYTDESFSNDTQMAEKIQSDKETDEVEEIREWALNYDIKQAALDKLLLILRKKLLPQLPKSSKTFLRTKNNYKINMIFDDNGKEIIGQYVYFGLEEGIRLCVNTNLHQNKEIKLQFNVDGLPLFNSGKKQFWPILCKIFSEIDICKSFVVAIFNGNSKPSDIAYTLLIHIEPKINLISQFVLDSMHLYSGVMKKLIEYWVMISGKARISRTKRVELSRRMLCLRNEVPFEFQRRPRSTNDVRMWNATEFRSTSKIGSKSQILNMYNSFCRFICIIHIADDTKNLGCNLNYINCYPFESYLCLLKRYIRKADKPLEQVCRRLNEKKSIISLLFLPVSKFKNISCQFNLIKQKCVSLCVNLEESKSKRTFVFPLLH
ncbi:hypothetical protein ALC60_03309 [Trachymyrmex zeteki]|uniref:Uncharacterized protein n=1 Tax=Mycetomoellerius zeteki TaxID=64791 RepID=A0A151XBG3_9HYME|nr:hypothetical protein ALC60_03309 [Trachymyrmex zeteki]